MKCKSGAGLASAALAVIAGGCTIRDAEWNHELTAFDTVYVEPFGLEQAVFVGGHEGHTAQEIQEEIEDALIEGFAAHGLAAQPSYDGAIPGGVVVVRGAILVVNSGSEWVWRGSITGPGHPTPGDSVFAASVELYDGSVSASVPACTFRVITGHSWLWKPSYPALADARDVAEHIVGFVVRHLHATR